MSESRPPSIKDIAERAGVSYQAVSRILNGGGRASAETRERVMQIASDIGYRRNAFARALVTRRSHTIGVIADSSPKYGPVSTLAAVQVAARAADYTTLVATVARPTLAEYDAILREFDEAGIEGIVVIAPRVQMAMLAEQSAVGRPIVVLAPGETQVPGAVVFYEDQEQGARLATRHLIDLGHRHIAHIAGSQEWLDGQVRVRGWQAEMSLAQLPAPRIHYGDWTGESAYEIGRRMIATELPTAVFVASDLMALGFMRALNEAGLKVPGDVSIVGFDDNEFSAQTSPPFTTVRQSFVEVGTRCVEILVDLLAGRPPHTQPLMPKLVIRQSTGPVRR
jgi:DNA-binding LacI/PurR family transcriptional regulator